MTGLLAALMILAVATSALASCLSGPAMTAESMMACCKAGHHECGPEGKAEQCCKTEGQGHRHFAISKGGLTYTPPVLSTVHDAASVPALNRAVARQPVEPFDRPPLKLPHEPTYLFNATFLL